MRAIVLFRSLVSQSFRTTLGQTMQGLAKGWGAGSEQAAGLVPAAQPPPPPKDMGERSALGRALAPIPLRRFETAEVAIATVRPLGGLLGGGVAAPRDGENLALEDGARPVADRARADPRPPELVPSRGPPRHPRFFLYKKRGESNCHFFVRGGGRPFLVSWLILHTPPPIQSPAPTIPI